MDPISVTVESIDIEGKGIAKLNGKTVFINQVLPHEQVAIEIYKQKPKFDLANLVKVLKPSLQRVTPKCPNFGICGGCSLQHIEFMAQVKYKEKVLIDNLKHIGKVEAKSILPPLYGMEWGYRHKARLSVRYVAKKGGALVGFREKASSYVAQMNQCLILPPAISNLIPGLRNLVNQLSIYDQIPQIEVAVGEKVSVLVFRIMANLTLSDEEKIRNFAINNSSLMQPLQVWLQPKGPDSCYPFYPTNVPQLSYLIKNFNLDMPYYPTEFTQVNPLINNDMVTLAVKLLEIKDTDIVADFFCGIGNFSLAIAQQATRVIGIEGSEKLIARAIANAKHNRLDTKTCYQAANLFTIDAMWLHNLGKIDKWLIDPPRVGAIELVKAITPLIAPSKIVYVSCNPATLARDASVLVNVHGYSLIQAGVMNMFPHTSHIEAIAVFTK